MVRFTLQRELVKEFMQHLFYSDLMEDNMMHGFTPFCIQCMDKKSKYNLISREKKIDFASHMVEADFDKKEAALRVTPITDALGFIAAISNTRALAWALFMSTSPLSQDLHDLYETVIGSYQSGELEAARNMQPDWYAHALWSLYKDISKNFKKQFTEDNLHQGYCMKHLLMDYIKKYQDTQACPHLESLPVYWCKQSNWQLMILLQVGKKCQKGQQALVGKSLRS